MTRNNSQSIQKMITLNLVILGLCPIIIIGVIVYFSLYHHLFRDLRVKNYQIARSVASDVQRFMTEPTLHMRQLEKLIVTQIIKEKEIEEALTQYVKNYPYFEMLQVLDVQGTIQYIAPYNPDFIGIDMSGYAFYRDAVSSKKLQWSSTFMSMDTKQPIVSIALPFSSGMIVAYFNLEHLKKITDNVTDVEGSYACVLDAQGTVLAYPTHSFVSERLNIKNLLHVSEGLKGNEGLYRFEFDGVSNFGSVVIVPGTEWLVAFVQRADIALAPLSVFIVAFVIIFAGTLGLGFFILMRTAKKILFPIDAMIQKVQHIAQGDYAFSVGEQTYDELNTLMSNFETMKLAIQDRESQLRNSEATVKSIFRVAPIGIGVVTERMFTWVNDRMCTMIGFTKEQLIGQSARILYATDEEYERVGRVKYGQIQKYGTGTVETQFRTKNGSIKDVLLSSTPLDIEDWSKGVTFTALDITEWNRSKIALQRSRDDWENIFNSISDCALILDVNHTILDVNKATLAAIKKSKIEIVGQKCFFLFHLADHSPEYCPHETLLQSHCPETREMEVELFGGTYLVSASPVFERDPNGNITLVKTIHIAKDITEMKKTQAELQALKDDLQFDVERKTSQLSEVNTKLIQSERLAAMGQLAGTVAHEFRNQLGVMRNIGYLLKTRLDNVDAKTNRHLSILDDQIVTTDRIIENILTFSRVKKPQYVHINVPELFDKIVNKIRLKESVHASIETSITMDDEHIDADEIQLIQIFDNLLNNAVESIAKEGHILISILQKENSVEFQVIDDGGGVPDEVVEKVFDPLFTTKARGAGLGLSTVKAMVQAHDGAIMMQSVVNQGTTVTITLPQFRP